MHVTSKSNVLTFPTFPDGFPPRILDQFVTLTNVPGVLGNIPASGTEIIKNLGEEHVRSGKPIVYTSADSVFQIAAHEEIIPIDRLYEMCEIARKILDGPDRVGRVIARPFLGTNADDFKRTTLREAKLGDQVTVAAGAGTKPVRAMIVGKQEFAGYWEYFLDEAIFTSPAHPFWGGAGAIDSEGRLIGVGSLHVEQLSPRTGPRDINMIVPIDLLPPILDDLLTYGRVNKPARPWLGVFSAENGDEIIVASVAENGPAAEAGLRRGDVLAGVGGAEIESLGDFYRKIWSRGPAGVEIPIEIVREGKAIGLRVLSADRSSFMKRPRLQ